MPDIRMALAFIVGISCLAWAALSGSCWSV